MKAGQRGSSEYVAIVRMRHGNAENHLIPISMAVAPSKLWIVRPEPKPSEWRLSDDTYVDTHSRFVLTRLVTTLFDALRIARRPQVRAIISFNALPYGLIAALVGRLTGKPVHVGFVGTDAFKTGQHRYGRLLDRLLRRANLVTVPGPGIARQLERRGYTAKRIVALPHAVDLRRWVPPTVENRMIDLLFVGALEPHKQVSRIIRSVADLRQRFPNVSLAVVGDGSERLKLERLADELGISQNVVFAGYQPEPVNWYQSSRFVVIASRWEGFPFVIVEGMCTGVVPVAARVGAIGDVITHRETGYLFNGEDPRELTNALHEVLSDRELSERMRARVLRDREFFGYEPTAELWKQCVSALGAIADT